MNNYYHINLCKNLNSYILLGFLFFLVILVTIFIIMVTHYQRLLVERPCIIAIAIEIDKLMRLPSVPSSRYLRIVLVEGRGLRVLVKLLATEEEHDIIVMRLIEEEIISFLGCQLHTTATAHSHHVCHLIFFILCVHTVMLMIVTDNVGHLGL